MNKLKSFGRNKPAGGLLGAELEDLARAATKKTLPAPDEELIQQVVDAINASTSEASCPTQVVDMLHKRLTQHNPHKVWLATALTGKILEQCGPAVASVKGEIYGELAAVAAKPLDRYQENFKSEQRAKMNAFAILRASGKEAQSVLRRTAGLGKMVSLTPPANNSGKSCSRSMSGDGSKLPPAEELAADVTADATGRPPAKGWTVKHVSGKDAAMNAAKAEKHDARDAKIRAAKAAKADAKAGRGTVGDTPEEASRAAAQAQAAAASSSALAEAIAAKAGNGGASSSSSVRKHEKGAKTKSKHPSWPETQESVTTSIGIAGSHTEMIQDLVKNLTSGNSAAPDFERHFLDDLVKEMTTFRAAFEQLMALLTTFHTPEASALLTQALRAIDEMNSTMALYQDVVNSMPAPSSSGNNSPAAAAPAAVRTRSRELAAGASSSGGAQAHSLSQYAPAAKSAPPAQAGSAVSPLDSLMDMQAALGQPNSLHRAAPGSGASSRSSDPFTPNFSGDPQQGQPQWPAASQGMPAHTQPMPYSYMAGPMYHQGQFPGAPQHMGYNPWGNNVPPQVMYMPVTGPNGEQGFAPVPMHMPQGMGYPPQGMPPGGQASGPMQFVQGPNGYFMPVPMSGSQQGASASPAASSPPVAGSGNSAVRQQQEQQQSPPAAAVLMPASSAQSSGSRNPFAGGDDERSAEKAAPSAVPQAHASQHVQMPSGVAAATSGGSHSVSPAVGVVGVATPDLSPALPPLPRASSNGSLSARTTPEPPLSPLKPSALSSPSHSIGTLSRPESDVNLPRDASTGSLAQHARSPSTGSLTGITARRIDSTGSGIFPAQAADSVLDSAGLRAWSGADPGSVAPFSPAAAESIYGTASKEASTQQPAGPGAEPITEPISEPIRLRTEPAEAAALQTAGVGVATAPGQPHANGTDAQKPTFDAIFDDILAS